MTESLPNKTIARLRQSVPTHEWAGLLRMLRTNWPPGGSGWWLAHQTPAVRKAINNEELRAFCHFYQARVAQLGRVYDIAPPPPSSARTRLDAQRARVFLRANFLRHTSTGRTVNSFELVRSRDQVTAVVTVVDGDILKEEAPRFVRRDVLRMLFVQRQYMKYIAPCVAEMPEALTLQPLWLEGHTQEVYHGVPMRLAYGRYVTPGKGFTVCLREGWIAWCDPGFRLAYGSSHSPRAHRTLLTHHQSYKSARSSLLRAVRAIIPTAIANHARTRASASGLYIMDSIPELCKASVVLSVPGDEGYNLALRRLRHLYNSGKPSLPGYAIRGSLEVAGVKDVTRDVLTYALYAAWLRACLFADLKSEAALAWRASLAVQQPDLFAHLVKV